eukprot:TRINITY_DN1768_c1_g1_i1.p1 TRINITY_DN1768_c1_g1~~TRINITY_DN1768_c1_g1_i1.p1  ORF type:complete len:1066 (+),score=264.64 TRINITY_DN1768_c1_g1_i1:110-3307(+)
MEGPPEKRARTNWGEPSPAAKASPALRSELESDAKEDPRERLPAAVKFHVEDTTLNVLQTVTGGVLTQTQEGGVQHLLSGARGNVGVKSGRYMFEVQLLEVMPPADPSLRKSLLPLGAPPPPLRPILRIGFSSRGSTPSMPLVGDLEDSICFTHEGGLMYSGRTTWPCQGTWNASDTIAILLNLEEGSHACGTISVFRNGQRDCEAQALPENLRGKALFPTISFRGMTLRVNFGPVLLAQLPFKCRMLSDASADDVQVVAAAPKASPRCDVVVPIGLPDEGVFKWADTFLEKHPEYVEISDRMMAKWAFRSGLQQTQGSPASFSNDRLDMYTGISAIDEGHAKAGLLTAMSMTNERNLIIVEVKGNLLRDKRQVILDSFPSGQFRKVVRVIVGERSQAETPPNKLKKAERQRRRAEAQEERERSQAEAEATGVPWDESDDPVKKLEAELGPSDDENQAAEEVADRLEPPAALPDVADSDLSASFASFSLPAKEDGFDEITYDWSPEEQAELHLRRWVQARKMTTRVEDLKPGDWFGERLSDWQKELQKFRLAQFEFKDPGQRSEASKAAKDAQKKADKLEVAYKTAMERLVAEIDEKEIDVFGVRDVFDIGGGEPLCAHFTMEDWALLCLRFELHLLAHAFRRDCNDSERVGIPAAHVGFYYNLYYGKALEPYVYGLETIEHVVDMIRDAAIICGRGNAKLLESQLGDDLETGEVFLKLTEESRRDRARRKDAGDETAALHFTPMAAIDKPPPPPPQPMNAAGVAVPAVNPAGLAVPAVHPGQMMQPSMPMAGQHQMPGGFLPTPHAMPGQVAHQIPPMLPGRPVHPGSVPVQQQQAMMSAQQHAAFGAIAPKPSSGAYQPPGLPVQGMPHQQAWHPGQPRPGLMQQMAPPPPAPGGMPVPPQASWAPQKAVGGLQGTAAKSGNPAFNMGPSGFDAGKGCGGKGIDFQGGYDGRGCGFGNKGCGYDGKAFGKGFDGRGFDGGKGFDGGMGHDVGRGDGCFGRDIGGGFDGGKGFGGKAFDKGYGKGAPTWPAQLPAQQIPQIPGPPPLPMQRAMVPPAPPGPRGW